MAQPEEYPRGIGRRLRPASSMASSVDPISIPSPRSPLASKQTSGSLEHAGSSIDDSVLLKLTDKERKAIEKDQKMRKKFNEKGLMSDDSGPRRTKPPVQIEQSRHVKTRNRPKDPRHESDMKFRDLFSDEEQYAEYLRGQAPRLPDSREKRTDDDRVVKKKRSHNSPTRRRPADSSPKIKASKENTIEHSKSLRTKKSAVEEIESKEFSKIDSSQDNLEKPKKNKGMVKTLTNTLSNVGRTTTNVTNKGAKTIVNAGGAVIGASVTAGGVVVHETKKGAVIATKATKKGAQTAGNYTAKSASNFRKLINDKS